MRIRRKAGFTLVELMAVVTIIAVVAAVAARYSHRASAAEQTGETARALMLTVHEARESALGFGQTTRVRIDHTLKQFFAERYDTSTSPATWVALSSNINVPSGVDICDVTSSVVLTTASPSCPTSTDMRICFAASGLVTTTTTDVCPTSSAGTGATLFLQSRGDATPKHFKLMLFRLTGMPRMSDQW
jgi:type II secretion system protein H